MKSIIDTIIAILFILFGLNIGVEFLHKEVKNAVIQKLQKGLPPLSPFTRKMTGWDVVKSGKLRPIDKKK